jgi:hypothetical protein
VLCAYNAGIIERVLEEAVSLTVLGRMSTGTFDYQIEDQSTQRPFPIRVRNSQCEIDAGFEGANIFGLVEAKNETVSDFLVRQLFYPFRLWTRKIQKAVVPIFLSYSNDVFSFYIYRFKDLNNYNSIELIRQRRYQIAEREIDLQDVVAALARVPVHPEPDGVPFPQADSFSRVVDLLNQIHHTGVLSQEEITTNHAFDIRQTQYYTNAGRYLGLIVRSATRQFGVTYSLTARGSAIMARQPAARNLALVETMLEHAVFNEAVRLYLRQARRPDLNQVTAIMKNAALGLDVGGNTTISRRAQTVLAWLDWIMRLTRP